MRKFLIIFLCLIFAGLVTSTTVLAVKYSAEINKTEITQVTDTSGLVNTIEELQKLVKDLTADKAELQVKTDKLSAQNDALQAQISALQSQVDSDKDTIQSLQQQLVENEALIDDLNNQISNLEASIKYYEDYIQAFENENQVTATFVEEGKVIATPICNVGSKVTAPEIFSNEARVFVGWTVNDELVDLLTYTIQEDTTFVAKFNYYYLVSFTCSETSLNTEVSIPQGDSIASYMPTDPILSGYTFKGWYVGIDSDGDNSIDSTGEQVTSDYIPTNNMYIFAVMEKHTSDGTYTYTLWHPYLTVQGDITLNGETVTNNLDVTSCSVSGVSLSISSIEFVDNVLTVNYYVQKSATWRYFSVTSQFSYDIATDTFTLTKKTVKYASSGTIISGSDISSETTITFEEVV